MLTAWIVGIACRMGLLVRLSPWALRLPVFTAFVLTYLIQSAGIGYWLHDNERADWWLNATAPLYCGLRLLAFVEVMRWFARQFPRFRNMGYLWLLCCAIFGGLVVSMSHPLPEHMVTPWIAVGYLERATGIGVSAGLVLAVIGFSLLGALPRRTAQFEAAAWHAATLALWSLMDAIGWIQIHHKNYQAGGAVVIAGAIVCPILWMMMVRVPPNWQEPDPEGTEEEVDAAIRKMRETLE